MLKNIYIQLHWFFKNDSYETQFLSYMINLICVHTKNDIRFNTHLNKHIYQFKIVPCHQNKPDGIGSLLLKHKSTFSNISLRVQVGKADH